MSDKTKTRKKVRDIAKTNLVHDINFVCNVNIFQCWLNVVKILL